LVKPGSQATVEWDLLHLNVILDNLATFGGEKSKVELDRLFTHVFDQKRAASLTLTELWSEGGKLSEANLGSRRI
jgi:hypothetical protein